MTSKPPLTALARATPLEGWRHDDAQARLGDTAEPDHEPNR